MKLIKFVFNSTVFESDIVEESDNPVTIINWLINGLTNTGYSYSFDRGYRTWKIRPFDLTEVSKDFAQRLYDELLEMERIVGVDLESKRIFDALCKDCQIIIKGRKPLNHREGLPGVLIDYRERHYKYC